MEIKELVENGFLIYLDQNKFLVEKKATELNKKQVNNRYFESIEEAIEFVEKCIQTKEWKAIVRYNRGLGIEYKTLTVIEAFSLEEAKNMAKLKAENLLGDSIIEIKVLENF
jgi:hypothetical protein